MGFLFDSSYEFEEELFDLIYQRLCDRSHLTIGLTHSFTEKRTAEDAEFTEDEEEREFLRKSCTNAIALTIQ